MNILKSLGLIALGIIILYTTYSDEKKDNQNFQQVI